MKKLNLFQWSLSAVLVLGLMSCGQDEKDTKPKARVEVKEAEPQGNKKKHKLSYELFCPSATTPDARSTGRHSFESDKIEVVLSQYCQALKDEPLNNHCAPCERLIKYNEDCLPSGEAKVFQNCEAPTPTPTTQPETQVEEPEVEETEPEPTPEIRPRPQVNDLDQRLGRLWVQGRSATTSARSDLSPAEVALRRAYYSCGFTEGQPACEDFSSSWKSQIVLAGETEQTDQLVSQINGFTYENIVIRQPLIQILEVDPAGELVNDRALRIYALGRPLFGEDLISFVASPNSDLLILELPLVSLGKDTALTEMSEVESTKELVQLISFLVEQMEQGEEAPLAESLLGAMQVTETDSDFAHQMKLIEVIKSHFEFSKPLLEKLIAGQLKNENLEIKLLAACHSVLLGTSSEDVRSQVQQALQHSNPELNRLALKAMQRLELTVEDENLIIKSISDSSTNSQSFELAKSFSLTANHTSALIHLAQSTDLNTRKKALELAGLSSTSASTDFLISLSTDAELFQSVFGYLGERTLTEQQLQKLALGLRHNNPEIRLQVIKLLGQNPSDNTTSHLVSSLNDPSPEVRLLVQTLLKDREMGSASDMALISALENSSKPIRDQAYAVISTRALNDAHVTELEALLVSPEWEARYNAIRLLGTVDSRAATAALIRSLDDPADSLVGISFALLLTRDINAADINDLARLLKSTRPSVREKAQQLLTTIDHPRATALLNEHQIQEEAQDVQ